jgi:DNA (cytosine-5)-methyltransferase 1
MDLGFVSAGFDVVWANDFDPAAAKVYEANLGLRIDRRDIRDVPSGDIPDAYVVMGGLPCQPFSVAGKRLGTKDPRGLLYRDFMRVVEDKKPEKALFENVPNFFKAKNPEGDLIIDEVAERFSKMGYATEFFTLNAAKYCVAQHRVRAFMYAKRRVFPHYDILRTPFPSVTCAEALAGLPEPGGSDDSSQNAFSKVRYNPGTQGNKEIDLGGQAPTIRAEHHGNIEFRRLSPEHGGKNEPWLPERRLTVRECARLQGFPDRIRFCGVVSMTDAYKLIGNAVPPPVAKTLAMQIICY